MGIYFDLGRPIVGGWLQGGWVLHDPVRDRDLLWGSELGQEGAVLFAIDVDSGEVVEEHRIGCREFNATPDPETGLLWLATNHGLFQPATCCSPGARTLASSLRTASPPSAVSASPGRPCLPVTVASISAPIRTGT